MINAVVALVSQIKNHKNVSAFPGSGRPEHFFRATPEEIATFLRRCSEAVRIAKKICEGILAELDNPNLPAQIAQGESIALHLLSGDISDLRSDLESSFYYVYLRKNMPSAFGNLLHIAAKGNRHAAIPLLLKAGVKLNAQTYEGNTPLLWAVANAQVEAALTLVQMGADCCIHDWMYERQTPLQLAIAKGPRNPRWNELIFLLITHTPNLNAQNGEGNTALHLAYARRDVKIIEQLLEKGSDPTIKNDKRQAPEQLWDLTYEEAWQVIHGDEVTTTLNGMTREAAQRSIIVS